MNAIEAGLAAACVVFKAGWSENNETQINDMMTISKQISTSFSMVSSIAATCAAVPEARGAMCVPAHWCAAGAARFTSDE